MFIVSACGGLCFADEGYIWCAIANPRYTLTCQLPSQSAYSVALRRRKLPIFAVVWTSAFCCVANWQQSEKVEHSAQLETFPYPTVSKSFLYSKVFMAKSGAQSLTFNSATNKQTDKQKTRRFWSPRRLVKSEPHQTGQGDRGPRARSCTFKTFGV